VYLVLRIFAGIDFANLGKKNQNQSNFFFTGNFSFNYVDILICISYILKGVAELEEGDLLELPERAPVVVKSDNSYTTILIFKNDW